MTHDALKSSDPRVASAALLLAIGLLFALAFSLNEHDWRYSLPGYLTAGADDAHLRVEDGALTRRVGFPSIALLGLFCILHKRGRPLSIRGPLAVLLIFLFVWCLASLLWATDPWLTTRRLVVLACSALGAVGIARQLGPRGLCVLTLVVTTAYVALGVGVEIRLGTFRPFSAGYRFSGTMHPNVQGVCCGAMCLAAACLASHATRRKPLFIVLLVVGLLFLVLTKSRTSLGSLVAVLFVLWALDGPRLGKVVAVLGLAWAVCVVALAASIVGLQIEDSAANMALMGRHESTASLNGRTQLWAELLNYFWQRPFLGYGYDGFWNSGRIQDVSSGAEWTMTSAHSAYLETLLTVGLVGTGTLLLAMMIAIGKALKRYRAFGGAGVAFTICLLTFAAVNALLESIFFLPTCFVRFVTVAGVMNLALCPPDRTSLRGDDTPPCGPGTGSSHDAGRPAQPLTILKHEPSSE